MGSGGGKSVTQTINSTTKTTPQVPSWIQNPYQSLSKETQGFLDLDVTKLLTPANTNQTQAWARAGAGTDQTALNNGIAATQGLLGYTPQQIGPIAGVNGGNAAQVAAPDQSQYVAQTISPGLLSGIDLSAYFNPYKQNVIDAAMADLERGRAGAISAGQGAATLSGAYGGSRHGVADAETNRGFLNTAAATSAALHQAGYDKAQQGAQFDLLNKLNADTFNANSQNGFLQQYLTQLQQSQLANQASQDAATGRQFQGDLATQGANLQAALANQNAGLQGVQINQSLAQQLAALGLAQGEAERADTAQMMAAGDAQHAMDVQNNPYLVDAAKLQTVGGLLGLIPSDLFTGQISTTNGTQTVPKEGANKGASAASGAASGAAMGASTGNPWAALGGAVIGGLGGWFGAS